MVASLCATMMVVRPHRSAAAAEPLSTLEALQSLRLRWRSDLPLLAVIECVADPLAQLPVARSFKAWVTMASLATSRAEVASSSSRIYSQSNAQSRGSTDTVVNTWRGLAVLTHSRTAHAERN